MTPSRVAMVTGATGAIGLAIARAIGAQPGWEVVLVARDPAKAERAIETLSRGVSGGRFRVELADLSRRAAVFALAARVSGPLHVLVNNAAVAPPRRLETPEGIELVLATNVLGYAWLAEALETRLVESAAASGKRSRIVNVASYWAGDFRLDDLEFRERRYDNNAAYRQSKQANRMLTVVQADRLASHGIDVNACHPGDVNSRLSNDLGFGGSDTPEVGARTPAWLATSDDVEGRTGGWYEQRRAQRCQFGADRDRARELAAALARYAEGA
jgi:NAD(P)-dependent dehydrogenase (short-subunit alcohol dehydrogenase family)